MFMRMQLKTHAQTYFAIRRAGAMNELFPITVRQTQRIASQRLLFARRITAQRVIPCSKRMLAYARRRVHRVGLYLPHPGVHDGVSLKRCFDGYT